MSTPPCDPRAGAAAAPRSPSPRRLALAAARRPRRRGAGGRGLSLTPPRGRGRAARGRSLTPPPRGRSPAPRGRSPARRPRTPPSPALRSWAPLPHTLSWSTPPPSPPRTPPPSPPPSRAPTPERRPDDRHWTREMERFALQTMLQARGYAWIHDWMAASAKRWGDRLNITSGLLGGVVGTTGLVAIFADAAAPLWSRVVSAAVGFLIGLVAVLIATWRLGEMQKAHAQAQMAYASIDYDLRRQLAQPRGARKDAQEYMDVTMREFAQLRGSAPVVEAAARRAYVRAYPNNSIYATDTRHDASLIGLAELGLADDEGGLSGGHASSAGLAGLAGGHAAGDGFAAGLASSSFPGGSYPGMGTLLAAFDSARGEC